METAQVLKLIRKRLGPGGCTQRSLAAEFGVSEAYLSDVLAEKRNPGKSILKALGLTQRTVYEKKQ